MYFEVTKHSNLPHNNRATELSFSFYILGKSLFVPECTDVVTQADLSLSGQLQMFYFAQYADDRLLQ